ncbi:preprotein translocase subunit SecE [Planctomycetota bacterium]
MSIRIYKRGQGKYTRLWTGLVLAVIVGLGCLRLYEKLNATDLNVWVKTLVPAGLFAALASLVYWIVNKPSMADFMIAAEGEMKKVSWSSRQEIIVSTSIVIVVVVLMAFLLGVTDLVFSTTFAALLK